MTNEELVKLLQELSGGMTCGKHVIELEQAADRIELETGPMAEVTEADRNLFIHLTSADDETASRIRRGLIYTWKSGRSPVTASKLPKPSLPRWKSSMT